MAVRRVGVTFGLQKDYRYGVHVGYSDALIELGALPLMWGSGTARAVEASGDLSDIETLAYELVSEVDAVIISGGWDVDPQSYRAEASPLCQETEPERDRFEIAVIKAAVSTDRKVLGICRGLQVLNVAYGGTLIQDLVDAGYLNHSDLTKEYEVAHEVILDTTSQIFHFSDGANWVNTLHHQAVDEVGVGLRVVGRSPDGVVEAVEGDGVLGVQWHPERLFKSDARHLGCFRWLLS